MSDQGYFDRLFGDQFVASSDEERGLCASEIACAVADAWAAVPALTQRDGLEGMSPEFMAALDRLEAATRGSALRKVRP